MRTFFASVLGVLVSLSTAAAEVRVHFFDVGEGDSTAIEFESGKTVLIDAGNVRTGPRLVREAGLNSIDTLILTHPHPDHISGTGPLPVV
jgi:beta-lactamase superfamily II metal-dependent hydrolase